MDHFYYQILGFMTQCLRDVYHAQVKEVKSGATFVELGTFFGASAAYMAVEIFNSGKWIDFHTVDTFAGSSEVSSFFENRDVYSECLNNLRPVLNRISIHKQDSAEAAKMFKDHSVDFCFIDAAHDYDSCKADIEAWLPKMKPGGLLAGHDYCNSFIGVVNAVEDTLGNSADGDIEVQGVCWLYRIPVASFSRSASLIEMESNP